MISVERQQKLLLTIAKELKKPIIAYAVGGTAMMFLGFKDATLDIDLVFENVKDREIFKKAIKEIGYSEMDSIKIYGARENQPEMLSLGDERFDLFVDKIIHFNFSKNMKKRAEAVHQFKDNLILKITDYHDIILLKCATDRVKDIEDARLIIENKKIDWNILVEEAKEQIKLGNETTAFELGEFLEKLEKIKVKIPKDILNQFFNIVTKQMKEKQTS